MRADGKKTILKKDGDTIDIVKACVSVYAQNWRQVEEIKSQFASKTLFETLCKLSDFLRRNISYKIDPQGEQWIKTPARFIADGTGDCKSYSIFQMSVLTALGYECGFRFVSYRENGDYSHVYTIAKDENGELVPLDVVGIIQANIKEGEELDYVNKKDISKMIGQKKSNITVLKSYGFDCTVKSREGIKELQLEIERNV